MSERTYRSSCLRTFEFLSEDVSKVLFVDMFEVLSKSLSDVLYEGICENLSEVLSEVLECIVASHPSLSQRQMMNLI